MGNDFLESGIIFPQYRCKQADGPCTRRCDPAPLHLQHFTQDLDSFSEMMPMTHFDDAHWFFLLTVPRTGYGLLFSVRSQYPAYSSKN